MGSVLGTEVSRRPSVSWIGGMEIEEHEEMKEQMAIVEDVRRNSEEKKGCWDL